MLLNFILVVKDIIGDTEKSVYMWLLASACSVISATRLNYFR